MSNNDGGSSSSRRSTFTGAGDGIENAPNTTASASGKNKVRWNVHTSNNNNNNEGTTSTTTTTNNSNKLNTSIASASNAMTPSKRVKDRFVGVASGKRDIVMNYHFDGTPFSQKKRRTTHHHSHHGGGHNGKGGHHNNNNGQTKMTGEEGNQGGRSGEYMTSLAAANAIDNSFQLNNDTTAEILKMAGGANNNNMNESMLSMTSNASSMGASSSTATDSDMSGIDPLNCTTLSDTHELSTSNFIQNAKMRGVLADRAKALYGNSNNNNKEGKNNNVMEGKKMDSVWEKPFDNNGKESVENNVEGGGTTVRDNNVAVGDRFIDNNGMSSQVTTGGEADTLTLPDLTMNLTGVLSTAEEQHPPPSNTQNKREEKKQSKPEISGGEEEDDGEILEFTSHQRSRTPRKSSSGELSLLNSTSDDTSRSGGGLDSVLPDLNALEEDEEDVEIENIEDGNNNNINSAAAAASKGRKDVTMTTDLSKLIAESARMIAEDGDTGVEKELVREEEMTSDSRQGMSFVESTASQNDLANLLDSTEEEGDNGKEGNKPSESTPLASQPTTSSNNNNGTAGSSNSNNGEANESITSLCPSPSFMSGKKQRGSGIPMLRKSLGGDVSKIRKLTASLRKEKKSKKRMSLPALAMSRQQQQPGGTDRLSLGVKGSVDDDTKKMDSPPPKSPNKTTSEATSPPEVMNSPARNTRSARKSPSKKSPGAVDSSARNTRAAKKSGKFEILYFYNKTITTFTRLFH